VPRKFQSLSAELGRTKAFVYLIKKIFERLGGFISLQCFGLLADKVTLPKADIGDLVAIFPSCAYGPPAGLGDVLSHPKCREVSV
jgi:hypothetical protein